MKRQTDVHDDEAIREARHLIEYLAQAVPASHALTATSAITDCRDALGEDHVAHGLVRYLASQAADLVWIISKVIARLYICQPEALRISRFCETQEIANSQRK